LWGLDPTGYHVTNLVLHVAESLLLWVILARLGVGGAWLAALLFAVHPVNVESVAWIAQRKNLVAMLFLELSVLLYLTADADEASAGRPFPARGAVLSYVLSFVAFVLAMLGKGSAAVAPLFFLLFAWWRRRRVSRVDVLRTVPFFLAGGVLVLVNVWFQAHRAGTARDVSMAERLLGAGAVVWFYLAKAVAPVRLAFIYPQWDVRAGDPRWWLPLAAALGVTWLLWRRRESGSRPLLFAWAFFGIALVPVMGLTDVYFMKYALVADHYQHVALAGVAALGAAGWSRLARGRWRGPAVVAAAAGVAVLVFLTRQQCALYRDGDTLFAATLRTNPGCWLCHHNLAVSARAEGRREESRRHYEEAVRLKPDLVEAQVNLGILLDEDGRAGEALPHLEEAVRLDPAAPRPRYNLGLALAAAGRADEAIAQLQESRRLKPDDPEVLASLGLALAQSGRTGEAIAQYEEALRLRPEDAAAHYNLGSLLTDANRIPEAKAHYEAALGLRPGYAEAHNNLAILLAGEGRTAEAVSHFREAIRLAPGFFSARMNLAETCARAGRREEALAEARSALEWARSAGRPEETKEAEAWLARRR